MKSKLSNFAFMTRFIADNRALLESIGGEMEYGSGTRGKTPDSFTMKMVFAKGINIDRFDGDGVTRVATEYGFTLEMYAHDAMANLNLRATYVNPTVPSDVDEGISLLCDAEKSQTRFRAIAETWQMSEIEVNAGIESLQKIQKAFQEMDVLYTCHIFDDHEPVSGVYFDPLRYVSGM
jgi:hypothetical protein